MKFEGFPANTRFTSVPDPFINLLAPGMKTAEIVLMLAVFNILFNKKGYPRYVTTTELASHPATGGVDVSVPLNIVATAGLLLPFTIGGEVVYFLNNPEGRRATGQTIQGAPKPAEISTTQITHPPPPLPNIFTQYEENIGVLTPMIAEELKDILDNYPEEWIRDAIKEAVSLNKRSIRYVQRILERWVAEGKNSYGTHRSDIERDKYVRGHYGGLVQR